MLNTITFPRVPLSFMDMSNSSTNTQMVDRIKTTSMENVSTGVLEKNIEHYLRSKDKAEK